MDGAADPGGTDGTAGEATVLVFFDAPDRGPDPQVFPVERTVAGSGSLLGALDATTTQFDSVDRAIYSLDGDVDAFYEWLQLVSPA